MTPAWRRRSLDSPGAQHYQQKCSQKLSALPLSQEVRTVLILHPLSKLRIGPMCRLTALTVSMCGIGDASMLAVAQLTRLQVSLNRMSMPCSQLSIVCARTEEHSPIAVEDTTLSMDTNSRMLCVNEGA